MRTRSLLLCSTVGHAHVAASRAIAAAMGPAWDARAHDGLHRVTGAARDQLRARIGLGDDPVVVVSAGGTGASRAHDRLLAALGEVAEPGRAIDVITFKGPAAALERRGALRIHRLGFRGHEEANAEVPVRAGAARWPRSTAELRRDLRHVLAGGGAALGAAAHAFHRPGAAARIAQVVEARA